MSNLASGERGRGQEADLWWGGCSGWALLPSALVCTALTVVVVVWAWSFVDRRLLQLTVWSLVGAIWLVQAWRWSYRLFGYGYRLTTRRLFIDRGFMPIESQIVEVSDIEAVHVEKYSHSRWTDVGRIVITPIRGMKKVLLEGVRFPETIAERIRAAVQDAANPGR